jgi:hypothetical protein
MNSRHFYLISILILLIDFCYSKYDKLEWKICGPSDIEILENTITPMVRFLFIYCQQLVLIFNIHLAHSFSESSRLEI